MFVNEKGKVEAELSNEKWLWNLPFLCDVSCHLSDLKYQTSRSTEIHFWYVWSCQSFWNEAEIILETVAKVNLCCFPSCDLLHKAGSVSVLFPNVRGVEKVYSLAENFEIRFSDLRHHATRVLIFENHSPLKLVQLQKKCNLEWLNVSMTELYAVVSIINL